MRPLAGICVSFAFLLASHNAAAQQGDGAYGRLASDSAVQLDVGPARVGTRVASYASITARYLDTVGVYGTYSDDFRNDTGVASRSTSFGVEIRPLFLPRFTTASQSGNSTLDLFVDSLAIRLGAVIGRHAGFDARAPGFEAAAFCGLPLSTSKTGPWLGAGFAFRFPQQPSAAFAIDGDRVITLSTITLGWAIPVHTHLVDAGDLRRR